MTKAEIGKRYMHYKGKEYTVLALARMEETLEEVVVYRAEYNTDDFGPNPVWVRRRASFEGVVDCDGVQIDRFTLL